MSDPNRPGLQTSEFWLMAIAAILAALYPLLADHPSWQGLAGGALAVLGALGYGQQRASVKREQVAKQ